MASRLIDRRHPEWVEHRIAWEWLLDSYEGGERYRSAVYGYDSNGWPIFNLIRHKREYPDSRGIMPASSYDPRTASTDDDFALRWQRTPVPAFVREVIDDHLARIFAREISREAPPAVARWWTDCDGNGTTVDNWVRETVAPLLYCLGTLDVLVDRPRSDAEPRTQADVLALGLDRVVASVILPQDMVWWAVDRTTWTYREALIREQAINAATGNTVETFRHWTSERTTLYDAQGRPLDDREHPYGRVPIVRLFDRRKSRCEWIGLSRLEGTAERQREYYNRDSELILSDTTQAHPLLQGPEDFVQADGTIPIGPAWLLPKKKNAMGGSVTYEKFEVVDFPKGAQEAIRTNKQDLRDAVDREHALSKPAGSRIAGGGGNSQVVAQSGVSKAFDHQALANRLAAVAAMLGRAETQIARLVAQIAGADPAEVRIVYAQHFHIADAAEALDGVSRWQLALGNAGRCPEAETPQLQAAIRLVLPGRADSEYATLDAAIEAAVRRQAARLAAGTAVTSTDTVGVVNQADTIEGPGRLALTLSAKDTISTQS